MGTPTHDPASACSEMSIAALVLAKHERTGLTRWRDPVYLGRALAAHDCLEVAHSPASTVGGCVHGGRQLSALLERSRRAPCRWPSRHDYSYLFHEAMPGGAPKSTERKSTQSPERARRTWRDVADI